ncbi:unnamed protein product [Paramecium sonneborni]|uniref:Uncharacterized protein n=1 Tax=Paramecium sonneborni TaxID=65129 RepID=A0A8S1QWK5_9CILI|nr:unnamed protein product [Paramecium sonneborni]
MNLIIDLDTEEQEKFEFLAKDFTEIHMQYFWFTKTLNLLQNQQIGLINQINIVKMHLYLWINLTKSIITSKINQVDKEQNKEKYGIIELFDQQIEKYQKRIRKLELYNIIVFSNISNSLFKIILKLQFNYHFFQRSQFFSILFLQFKLNVYLDVSKEPIISSNFF